MKRFFMLMAAVILSTSWASPAQAQLGIVGFGGVSGPLRGIEAPKSQTKLKNQQYTKARPKSRRAQATRPSKSSYNYNYNSLDRFGRVDLSGHPISGYPAIRGNIDSMAVSRGGANGSSKKPGRRAK
jgi:hypothetical protein